MKNKHVISGIVGAKVIQFNNELSHTGEKVTTANGDDVNTNIIKADKIGIF